MSDNKTNRSDRSTSPSAIATPAVFQATSFGDAFALQTALSNIPQGVIMYDAGKRMVFCNRIYADLYRLPDELTMPGTPIDRIIDWRADNGLFHGNDAEEFRREVRQGTHNGTPICPVFQMPDGRIIAVSHKVLPGGGGIATHEDITAVHQLQERVRNLAQRDELTSLCNRAYLRERLEAKLAEVPEGPVAVLRIDLGRFRKINNIHGQKTGDTIIKLAAERLTACLGPSDFAGREEGDVFVIVQAAAEHQATELATRAVTALRAAYDIEGSSVLLDPKAGIAMFPADGNDVDQLLTNAHTALLGAHDNKQALFQFFASAMDSETVARRALELDLGKAIGNEEFEIHYQPLINLQRREIIGCEALLRWKHPNKGYLSPALFIPVAEASGLISPIGAWVLRRACADAMTWPSHIKVAVNLSPVQFNAGNLSEVVTECLAATSLPPSRLELEITEAVLLADSDRTLATLRELKALGVQISMDDFGTGYSSLGYLRRFPFDKIKIDRSFICDLTSENPGSRVLLRAIARVGTSLGIATLAEGIETEEQYDIVRQEGCVDGQGYLFERPQPAARIHELLWQVAASPQPAPESDRRRSDPLQAVRSPATREPATTDQVEEARLRALYDLELLDTPAEEAFDRITRLARAVLRAPMAMISLVDRDRQWFKSRQGVTIDEAPRHFSFCTHAIAQHEPLVVRDALLDPRFNTSPLVMHGSKVRAYAGVPLRTASGHNVGALCINDIEPRDPTRHEIDLLQDLAQLAIDEFELRRVAQFDNVTGALTSRNFRKIAQQKIVQARASTTSVICIVTDFDRFREFNNQHGHASGDRVLAMAARACSERLGQDDLIVRLGGDEFAVLQFATPTELAVLRSEEFRAAMEAACAAEGYPVRVNVGVAHLKPEDVGIDDLIARAVCGMRRSAQPDDGQEEPSRDVNASRSAA